MIKTALAILFLAFTWYFAFIGPLWAWLMAIGASAFFFAWVIRDLLSEIVTNDIETERLSRILDELEKRESGQRGV